MTICACSNQPQRPSGNTADRIATGQQHQTEASHNPLQTGTRQRKRLCANWVAACRLPQHDNKKRLRHHQRQYATAFTGYKAQRKQRASRASQHQMRRPDLPRWRPRPLTERFGGVQWRKAARQQGQNSQQQQRTINRDFWQHHSQITSPTLCRVICGDFSHQPFYGDSGVPTVAAFSHIKAGENGL